MPSTLTFAGQQIGSELLYVQPEIARLTPPAEEEGAMRDAALLLELGANLIHRPRFVVFHEAATPIAFAKWMIQMARMLKAQRADVVASEDDGDITWPNCALVSFERPIPRTVAEAMFSADVALTFVTDEEPF